MRIKDSLIKQYLISKRDKFTAEEEIEVLLQQLAYCINHKTLTEKLNLIQIQEKIKV